MTNSPQFEDFIRVLLQSDTVGLPEKHALHALLRGDPLSLSELGIWQGFLPRTAI